jgi:hypothetical protein
MNNVAVVSAFVPLNVKHMTADRYMDLGGKMCAAACRSGATADLIKSDLVSCWSYDLCAGRQPATSTPADRYATPRDHVNSHIVQHTRTQWALQCAKNRPEADVIVWLDLGILKQGDHTGKRVTEDDVSWFVDMVQMYPFADIPFPGISGPDPWLPHGNNWRFCGSTHIWPVKWLETIDRSYRYNLRHFVHEYDAVPLDLAIWPLVEFNSGLPFKWYQAEYDNTQLRNFPCAI